MGPSATTSHQNGPSSPIQVQAITLTNDVLLSIGPSGTKFNEILWN